MKTPINKLDNHKINTKRHKSKYSFESNNFKKAGNLLTKLYMYVYGAHTLFQLNVIMQPTSFVATVSLLLTLRVVPSGFLVSVY